MGLDQSGEDKQARKNRLCSQLSALIPVFFEKQETGKQRDRQKNDQCVHHGSGITPIFQGPTPILVRKMNIESQTD